MTVPQPSSEPSPAEPGALEPGASGTRHGGLPAGPVRIDAGAGVVLRGYRPQDVDAVAAMAGDEELQRWTTVPVPYRRADAEAFVLTIVPRGWSTGTDLTWAVHSGGAHAGNVSLRPQEGGGVEVGFALDAAHRGRGVMTAALRALLPWAAERGVPVVHWRAHVGNWASRRVAWACGFRAEGTVRRLLPQRGELRDAWVGSWCADDPLTPVSPWLEVPRVEVAGIVLRPWGERDVDRVVEGCTDPLTRRWLPHLPQPYTAVEAAAFLEGRELDRAQGRAVAWAVADARTDLALASVTLFRLEPGATAELGYWAHPDARGRGAVTAGVRAAARHALLPADDGGLGRQAVLVRCEPANLASAAVAVRVGFAPAGRDVVAGEVGEPPAVELDRYLLRAEDLPLPQDTPPARRGLPREEQPPAPAP